MNEWMNQNHSPQKRCVWIGPTGRLTQAADKFDVNQGLGIQLIRGTDSSCMNVNYLIHTDSQLSLNSFDPDCW